jgi:hypothetical protein
VNRLSKIRFAILLSLLFVPRSVWGAFPPANCALHVQTGPTPPSWTYMICRPPGAPPSTDLLVFAPGFVPPTTADPVPIPQSQLSLNGQDVPSLVLGLNLAFATTSYPRSGLAVKEGTVDVKSLVEFYKNGTGETFTPNHVYLAGVSEGGLVVTRAIEQNDSTFSGGLALCGPIGDFRSQINYIGDVRILFDHYFPNLFAPGMNIPNSPVDIDPALLLPEALPQWFTVYLPQLLPALAANPVATSRVLADVSADPTQKPQAVQDILGYNVFDTNDVKLELGGQPFDNRFRWYTGSPNDFQLNRQVERFKADQSALNELRANYQTTGKLKVPLVNMFTTGDHVVPRWQETIYGLKVLFSGSLRNYVPIPITRYGHCNFTTNEVLFGFGVLAAKAH